MAKDIKKFDKAEYVKKIKEAKSMQELVDLVADLDPKDKNTLAFEIALQTDKIVLGELS